MHTLYAQPVVTGLSFGEGPRWREGRLWYSDMYRHGVFSLDPSGEERRELAVTGQSSGLGWLPNGDLLYVSMIDQRVMRYSREVVSLFADLAPYCTFWANDMLVTPSGVSYVGNFGFDLDTMLREVATVGAAAWAPRATNLVVLGPDGSVRQVVPDLSFPNGMALTSDGATLVVAESTAARLSAFDVGPEGTLSGRRVWADLSGAAPDGICADDRGRIWYADALSDRCRLVSEGGEIVAEVVASRRAFACALGGEGATTLFVMCATSSDRFDTAQRRDGCVEAASVAAL